MNAYFDDEGNNDEDAPDRTYDCENTNAYSNNEENNDEVAPNPPVLYENINANYDDEKVIMSLPLIKLQMA